MRTLAVVIALWEFFAPPARILPSEFARANLVLPASTNAEPGPFVPAPYQPGLIDAIDEEGVEVVVFMLASQTGKSLAIDAALAYIIAQEPGPILVVHPTDSKAKDYVRDRLNPLFKSSTALAGIFGDGGQGGRGDAIAHKTFAGGSLNLGSSYQADTLAARAIRYLLLDEVDRFAQSAGTEGDPIALAIKRTRTFANRKIIIASTPTLPKASRIAAWFARGDQRRFYVPCLECGSFDYLRMDRLKWTEGKPETAKLECVDCGGLATDRQRREMIEQGTWKPTATGEKGIVSFHGTEIMSKFSSLESVARQFEDAKTPEAKTVFVNTVLAEPFDSGLAVELNASDLARRAEPIAPPLPEEWRYMTVGVDIQANRIEATFLAHAKDGRRAVLNHFIFNGDTSSPAPWGELDTVLGAYAIPTQDGRRLPLGAVAVDSGFMSSRVYEFVSEQRAKHRRAFAIKGHGGFDRDVLKPGRRVGTTQLLMVGVDGVKLEVQQALAMVEPAPGFIHLADHLAPEYFDSLASERLETRYVRGYARHEFHKTTRGNEALDCLCYAAAIAGTVNVAMLEGDSSIVNIAEAAAKLKKTANLRS